MITISLCMIVKNEESVLPRILAPMRNLVDEIIIVDTGSTDQTKAIALQFTPYVFDFVWQQDFSAARNFACSKATKEYWMWLDADDTISPFWQKELLHLKDTLDSSVDMVMMKYVTAFDKQNKPLFFYYRERLMKNNGSFLWKGSVHEAVTPAGNILYSPIEIEHRKITPGDPDRNLKIYEALLEKNEPLEPRHQFYYGRELYYHGKYPEAVRIFRNFLKEPGGWVENQIDACLQLSHCLEQMHLEEESLASLFYSFSFDMPRPEICCEIGRMLMKKQRLSQAIYWYEQALNCAQDENSGAFIQKDYQDFIPYLQLCVCYDRLGLHETAYAYNKLAMAVRPDSETVLENQAYFEEILHLSPEHPL